jgi:methionine-rich copper-binding protein CopC
MRLNWIRPGARTLSRPRTRFLARRAFDLAVAIVLFVVVATTFGSEPASAHERVVSSTPAPGATLVAAPESVALRFQGRVTGVSVDVRDACGRSLPGEVTISGAQVTATVRPESLAAADIERSGQWNVTWRAVGADGHLAEGHVPFVVRGVTSCAQAAAVQAQDLAGSAPRMVADFPMMPIGVAILVLLALLAAALLRRLPSAARS